VEQAGISGPVALRPYLYLTESEMQKGRLFENQVAIQSTGKSSKYFMWTKEWYPDRFQEVVEALKPRFNFVQIGGEDDPKLEGTTISGAAAPSWNGCRTGQLGSVCGLGRLSHASRPCC